MEEKSGRREEYLCASIETEDDIEIDIV